MNDATIGVSKQVHTLSVCVCVCHTHTHTHIHTQVQQLLWQMQSSVVSNAIEGLIVARPGAILGVDVGSEGVGDGGMNLTVPTSPSKRQSMKRRSMAFGGKCNCGKCCRCVPSPSGKCLSFSLCVGMCVSVCRDVCVCVCLYLLNVWMWLSLPSRLALEWAQICSSQFKRMEIGKQLFLSIFPSQVIRELSPPQTDSCASIQRSLMSIVDAVETATRKVVDQRKFVSRPAD